MGKTIQEPPVSEKVAAPILNPASSYFTSAISVTIYSATSGADIYYTLDGADPSATSAKYTDAIQVSSTTTIKAIAIKGGLTNSEIVSATYIKNTQPSGDLIKINLDGGVTLEMVKINAAGKSFLMGSTAAEQDSLANEQPAHTVSFARDYYIGKYEITQSQWLKIYGSWPGTAPSSDYGLGANYPAYFISWNDISAANTGFLAKLNQLAPGGYTGFRLPTEAEWEYAARGGTQTRFYWGDDPSYTVIDNYAWYGNNSNIQSQPAYTKLVNAFDLFDMSGNVAEWCGDLYGGYGASAVSDPTGPSSGTNRVYRGGGWSDEAGRCRSASRSGGAPSGRYDFVGFRIVLPVNQ